ncbi:MAG: primosomal protein N', partial [Alphaproteobacteria bacterium]
MRLKVLIPLPLAGPYDYLAPEGMPLKRGDHVVVPLGPREVAGVVWEADVTGGEVPEDKLKPVAAKRQAPPLPRALCDFVDWVAGYTLYPQGAVLALALRSRGALEPERTRTVYRAAPGVPEGLRMTAARERVLEAASRGGGPRTPAELARAARTGPGVVKALAKAGALEALEAPEDAPFGEPDPEWPGPLLSEEQEAAAARLRHAVAARRFEAILLDGVTGAGKTEVYFEAVAAALRAGRQVLILLPEIALTVSFLERFERRFGCRPAEWHSDLTQAKRRRTWRQVARGQARVVAGARSALFLPFPDPGLIVVDEEHDAAFKQEDGVTYNARDMAVVRARLSGCPVVLSSATPSLETHVNAEHGRYARVRLPARHGAAQLPGISALDMRAEPPPDAGRWLSPALVSDVNETLARGEQALLFLNRRGYAPLTLCRACGHRMTAPDTSTWLVEHRYTNRLVCHHTGYSIPKPKTCPECGAEDSLHACGPGVERIAEEVRELFPEARAALMSSDLIAGPAEAQGLIDAMASREIDLLIGTQMVAKGHNFPFLTLVGVVDADLGLTGGDLRAGERTYQLLHQVAGRAGRAERPGHVRLQTYMPDHPVMRALIEGARDGFLDVEAAQRQAAAYPPFGRLASVILSSPDEELLRRTGRALAQAAPRENGVTVFGPATPPLAVIRGRHRLRFLLKTGIETRVQPVMRQWLGSVRIPGKVRLSVDVDPY